MVIVHCAISQSGILKLSFLEAGYTFTHHNFIRFLCIVVILFIRQHLVMGVIGYGWTWQVPTTLATYWRFPSNTAFALFPRMQIDHVTLLRLVADFWAMLKKAV